MSNDDTFSIFNEKEIERLSREAKMLTLKESLLSTKEGLSDENQNDAFFISRKSAAAIAEVVEYAEKVREWQKKYFRTRDKNDLIHSKDHEHRLDRALKKLNEIQEG